MERKQVFAFVLCIVLGHSIALALEWNFEGTSLFTTDGTHHDKGNRMMLNDAVVDDFGRIFTTANLSNNYGSPFGAITIYEPDGSGGWIITDVNLDASGYPGVVTKLINVDGKVYGLQNFYWVEWWECDEDKFWGSGSPPPGMVEVLRQDDRIIRINSDGTVDEIINNGRELADRIVDITPGHGDGKIYMTMNGDLSRYYYFKRVDPSGSVPYIVEDSLHSGTNDGWGTRHSLRDLVPAGTLDDGSPMWIALNYNRSGDWRGPTGMGWESDDYRRIASTPAGVLIEDDTNWGWEWVTELAYNNTTKQLWVGAKSWEHYQWAWDRYGTAPSVDIIGGATGGADTIQPDPADVAIYKTAKTAGNSQWSAFDLFGAYWADVVPNPMTAEIRFRINSYSTSPNPTYAAYIMRLGFYGPYGDAPNSPIGMIYFDGDTGHLELHQLNLVSEAHTATVLADLGAVSTGTWYTVRLILDNSALTAKCYLDGIEKYNGSIAAYGDWFEGRFEFGSAIDVDEWAFGHDKDLYVPGYDTASVDFDYAAVAPGVAMIPPDNSQWLNGPATKGGLAGSFMDGRCQPARFMNTAITCRFDGNPNNYGFFTHVNTNNRYVGPEAWSTWHQNASFPVESNQPNGGHYWCSALSVNPKDGSAYMSWSGENGSEYGTYYRGPGEWGPVGNVYRMSRESDTPEDEDLASNNLGTPQTGHIDPAKVDNRSHVEDIVFNGDKVYALVVDVEAGEYNLFSADNPAPGSIVSAVARKQHGQAGEFDIDILQAGSTDPRVGGPDTIVVTFDSMIEPADGELTIGDEVSLSNGTISNIESDLNTLYIHTNNDFVEDACLTVTIQGLQVPDYPEWTIPTQSVTTALIPGDAYEDEAVNVVDIARIKMLSGEAVNVNNYRHDLNADGAISVTDVIWGKYNSGDGVQCPGN